MHVIILTCLFRGTILPFNSARASIALQVPSCLVFVFQELMQTFIQLNPDQLYPLSFCALTMCLAMSRPYVVLPMLLVQAANQHNASFPDLSNHRPQNSDIQRIRSGSQTLAHSTIDSNKNANARENDDLLTTFTMKKKTRMDTE